MLTAFDMRTFQITVLLGIDSRTPDVAIVEDNTVVDGARVRKVLDRLLEHVQAGVEVGFCALVLLGQGAVALEKGGKFILDTGHESKVLLLEFGQTFLWFGLYETRQHAAL